ncbi:MAG TPA: hypothetical protein VNG33_07590, partial [Polyangiaceae bacterium]|nr:hypothetical protein [Polyangiaceae bacterium]
KWFGRPLVPLSAARLPSQNVEQLGEQTTLRSVTSPCAPVSHPPIVLDVRQRGRRRLLGAAVVVTTLAGGAAWGSWDRSARQQGSPSAWPPSSAASLSPVPPPPDAAPAGGIAIDALPLLPQAAPLASATKKAPTTATQPTNFHIAAPASPSALPRALPARKQSVDLLNPY